MIHHLPWSVTAGVAGRQPIETFSQHSRDCGGEDQRGMLT
jgi:hypothetical protein